MLRSLALTLIAAIVGLGCATTPVHQRPWIEVRTENFEILSPRPAFEVVELARNLELFRSVVERITGLPIRPGRVPLRVFALDRGTYRRYDSPRVAGYFLLTPRQGTIVLGESRGETDDVLRHEYVHFLLHNQGGYAYPPWYDEGFAELLSNVEPTPDFVEIGHPQGGRLESLGVTGWMSLKRLMSLRSLEGLSPYQTASFYSLSWALLHYLNLGRENAKTSEELARYLKALRRGVEHEEAVRGAFGVDSATLGHRLRRYIQRGRYVFAKVPRDAFDPGEEPRVRAPTSLEVAVALGELSAALQSYGQAEAHFAAALGEDPRDPRALAGYATAMAYTGRGREAEAWFAKALGSNPADPVAELDYANYVHALARGAEDPIRRREFALQARQHYVNSWKLDDSIPETYAAYGTTFLLEGQQPASGLETLEHAHAMLPSSVEIKVALARLYAKLGRRDEARELALVATMWNHGGDVDEELRELLE